MTPQLQLQRGGPHISGSTGIAMRVGMQLGCGSFGPPQRSYAAAAEADTPEQGLDEDVQSLADDIASLKSHLAKLKEETAADARLLKEQNKELRGCLRQTGLLYEHAYRDVAPTGRVNQPGGGLGLEQKLCALALLDMPAAAPLCCARICLPDGTAPRHDTAAPRQQLGGPQQGRRAFGVVGSLFSTSSPACSAN